uniref:Serine protease n=1 Tax=Riboviria sp. TaxID=2585031 RepID=A0A8K1U3G1_9VIRU|nr:MAG: hypothetical protein 2 [Riboviria sp.]
MADFGEEFFDMAAWAMQLRRPVVNSAPGFLSGVLSLGGKTALACFDAVKSAVQTDWRNAALIGGGAAAAVVLTKHYGPSLGVSQVCDAYRWVRVKCGGEPTVVTGVTPLATKRNTLESVRAGSTESKMPSPANQAQVGELVGSEFRVIGCAVRMKDWLIMPAHVYAAVDKPVAKGKQSMLALSSKEYTDLDTDLIGIKLTNQELSVIGLRDVGCYNEIPRQGAFTAICGSAGNGTTGVVRLDPSVFGRVTYDGTTVAGYSGAAYMSGNSLIGIHTSGGVVNGGYAAGYVKTLLQVVDKERFEDSEDWLQNVYKSGREIKFDPKWRDLDEVRIQVGGRFSIVSRDSMRRAFGNSWEDEITAGRFSQSYGDVESGEGAKTSISGGSKSLDASPDLAETKVSKLMAEYAKLSTKQKKKVSDILRSRTDSSSPPPPVSMIPTGSSSV